jgi:hypothetical protein
MPRKLLVAIAVFVVCLVLLAFGRTYVLRQSMSDGKLYWNTNEALLFITEANEGAEMSYARYALEPFFVSLGLVRLPSNKRCSATLVFRVTDHEVQRYDTDLHQYASEPYCGFHFDLFQGHIYAVSWPRLWKWTGTAFEAATPEESRAFDEAGAASLNSPPKFDNVDSWSMRELGQTKPEQKMVLNGQPLMIVFHGATWPPKPLSVELIREGQTAQAIWSLDDEPRRISKSEYEYVFGHR